MVCVSNEYVAGWNIRALRLGMATETKVGIIVHQQLFIDGTVGVMTNRAAFAQRLVLKDKWPCLRLVTVRTTLILPRHCQASLRFEDVSAVGIVAIHAIHIAFNHRMMLGQIEFSLRVEMALETGRRIFSRIDNEAGRASAPDMFAARTMAGFATTLPGHSRAFDMQPRVRTGRKFADDLRVTIGACTVADVVGAGNLKRSHNRRRRGST